MTTLGAGITCKFREEGEIIIADAVLLTHARTTMWHLRAFYYPANLSFFTLFARLLALPLL